jgi:hypothetical protein
MKSVAIMLALALIHLFLIPAAWAQEAPGQPQPLVTEDPSQSTASGAGLQAASWLLTLPYGATKVAFAILGGVTGGLTWLFSGGNDHAAKAVWTTSVYGTYVITPEHLTGDKAVRFLGVSSENNSTALDTQSAEPVRAK